MYEVLSVPYQYHTYSECTVAIDLVYILVTVLNMVIAATILDTVHTALRTRKKLDKILRIKKRNETYIDIIMFLQEIIVT